MGDKPPRRRFSNQPKLKPPMPMLRALLLRRAPDRFTFSPCGTLLDHLSNARAFPSSVVTSKNKSATRAFSSSLSSSSSSTTHHDHQLQFGRIPMLVPTSTLTVDTSRITRVLPLWLYGQIFDRDFDTESFVSGAKMACEQVNLLYKARDWSALRGALSCWVFD